MAHEWLLVETLGTQPLVVAQGHRLRKMIPLSTFLRRNPHASAIEDAIQRTVGTGAAEACAISGNGLAIRTEPVIMTDGRIHGVHVWSGFPSTRAPLRPPVGAVMWDLTDGVAADTATALTNAGLNPASQSTSGRSFAEDLVFPGTSSESRAVAHVLNCQPGDTFYSTWDVQAPSGQSIRINFVSRWETEPAADGTAHLVGRAMNWRSSDQPDNKAETQLANRILKATARPGLYRALVDLKRWRLISWIDKPCPYLDWRGRERDRPLVHPDDEAAMTRRLVDEPVEALVRLRNFDDQWTLLHVTVYRIELCDNIYAGLVAMRLPTDADLIAHSAGPGKMTAAVS